MAQDETVFLFDVDNTLIDNDRIADDLRRHLTSQVGEEGQLKYWEYFEQIRAELGYADYLGALQRYRTAYPRDFHILAVSYFILNYHFANRLFPGSLDVLEHYGKEGRTVLLTDGDVVFQPHKIERSGLLEAVGGHVLLYIHKEKNLDDVAARYPSRHYVLFDDKVRILAAVKKIWGAKVTTVFPRQGHYANDPTELAKYPPPDVTVERIADVLAYDAKRLRAAASPG